MAFAATVVWEVRASGDDANGGGFDPTSGTPGTDYSQQDAAQVTYTDLVIDGATNTNCTSAGTPFTSAHVGNIINITSGTGFTVQRVQVMSVAAGVATCDKSLGTLGSTGGNGKLGGGFASPGQAAGLMVANNKTNIRAGTYSIGSGTANTAGNRVNLSSGIRDTYWVGHGNAILSVTANSITAFTSAAPATVLENIQAQRSASETGTGGFSFSGGGDRIYNCRVNNTMNNGFASSASTGSDFINCYSLATTSFGLSGGKAIFCKGIVYSLGTSGGAYYCEAIGNGSTNGFTLGGNNSKCVNCIAYNHAEGFHGSTNFDGTNCINCIAANCTVGFSIEDADDGSVLLNCAAYNCGTDYNSIEAYQVINFQSLSADPFTNAAGGDFSINTTTGGGADLRSVTTVIGYVGQASSTTIYPFGGLHSSTQNGFPIILGAQG